MINLRAIKPRLSVNLLAISVRILVNLLVKLTELGQGGPSGPGARIDKLKVGMLLGVLAQGTWYCGLHEGLVSVCYP